MIPGQPPAQPPGQPFPASPPPQGNAPPPVTIDAVVKLLRDERMRGFRIDIETDSLVEADQTKERQSAVELVTAIGGFFKEFGPVVQTMPPLAPMAGQLLQFAVRRFKVGSELEEVIEKSMAEVVQHLNNPAPPQPNPEDQVKLQIAQTKAQAEGQKAAIGVQGAQVKAQAEEQKAQLDQYHAKIQHETTIQLAREKAVMDKEAMLLDAEIKKRADDRAHELHALKLTHERESHAMGIDKMHHEAGIKAKSAEHDVALKKDSASHDAKIKTEVASHDVSLKEKQAKAEDGHKKEHTEKAGKLEKLFAEISKAVKSPKKVIRDAKGEIVGIEHSDK